MTMRKFIFNVTTAICLFAFFVASINAQVCRPKETPQTISAGNFDFTQGVSPGEIAVDLLTGLKWQRCIYGQTWNMTTQQCTGNPVLLSWSEALQIAANSGLRLPDIKQLSSILDLQCINPPFNLQIFPQTYASEDYGLWTSSPHVESTIADKTTIWYVGLSLGRLDYRALDLKNYVRFLVVP